MTALHKSQPLPAVDLMVKALQLAVEDTRGALTLRDIDTLIALPSLMSDQHFMIGHAVAQQASGTLQQACWRVQLQCPGNTCWRDDWSPTTAAETGQKQCCMTSRHNKQHEQPLLWTQSV